jgi:hypothetical protein
MRHQRPSGADPPATSSSRVAAPADGDPFRLGGVEISRGSVGHVQIPLSEVAVRTPVPVHVTVVRGVRPGPRLFLTAGIHGDELNGVEIVRRVSFRFEPERLAGDLVCVPIVNVPGFVNRSRYLPDGSDLNRFFPGSPQGKPAERFAYRFLEEIVSRCDFGIDFHTAARGRANVAHVRADMDRPAARALARAFGTSIVVHRPGHRCSLRRVATELGVPTIVLEAGETGRLEERVGKSGVRGVQNVLVALGMLEDLRQEPPFQVIVRQSVWVRARQGGICELEVGPGALVYEGQRIGTNANPFASETEPIVSPVTGLVIGVSLDPVCEPGNPLCHIVRLKKTLPTVERHLQGRPRG